MEMKREISVNLTESERKVNLFECALNCITTISKIYVFVSTLEKR